MQYPLTLLFQRIAQSDDLLVCWIYVIHAFR